MYKEMKHYDKSNLKQCKFDATLELNQPSSLTAIPRHNHKNNYIVNQYFCIINTVPVHVIPCTLQSQHITILNGIESIKTFIVYKYWQFTFIYTQYCMYANTQKST